MKTYYRVDPSVRDDEPQVWCWDDEKQQATWHCSDGTSDDKSFLGVHEFMSVFHGTQFTPTWAMPAYMQLPEGL